ncbi:DUF7287 family protein [Halomicrobium salinisoli]|uniref:DUF7287 family protein n=1 Tax=Halomicrobium salinisoli TaxID=2878391 RepID=UPI001CF04ADE|nr:hypothetical protein [Halomicrobium salinisoli]
MSDEARTSRGAESASETRVVRTGSAGRGQTTLDFAIGTSLFLGIVLLVFLFVPGALDPFTEGAQAETVTADRVADDLAYGLLGSPQEPGVLDRECAVAFFANESPGECRFEGATTHERLGLTDRRGVNVTVRGNVSGAPDGPNRLCWNGGDARLAETDDGDCGSSDDVTLAAGDPLTQTDASSVTAVRTVSLFRTDVTILVEMW